MNPASPSSVTLSSLGKATPSVCLVVACNSDLVLETSLLRSPDLTGNIQVSVQRGATSAAEAYNRGIAETSAEILVFIHQDVYLPAGWLARLSLALAWLDKNDPQWGVLGICGVGAKGKRLGWMYSTGLGRVLGSDFPVPEMTRTLDEVLLVLRRSSGMQFDERMAGFHMYGTDICLEAEARRFKNYVVPCFALHNSNGIRALPWAFWKAYFYARRKWYDRLPVSSPCTVLSRVPLGAAKQMLRGVLAYMPRAPREGTRVSDPGNLFQRLVSEGRVQPMDQFQNR
jgi:hypothetical protein